MNAIYFGSNNEDISQEYLNTDILYLINFFTQYLYIYL